MEDFAEELLTEAIKAGVRKTVGSIYDYFVSNTNKASSAGSGIQLHHMATTYLMADNVLLYYHWDRRTVQVYDANRFGDQWLYCDLPTVQDNPSNFHGGVISYTEFYTDQYGRSWSKTI